MADPTASQDTAEERERKVRLMQQCFEISRTHFKKGKFLEAIHSGKEALQYCHDLGNEEDAQVLHRKLVLYYIAQCKRILDHVGRSEEALENAKLALKHFKEVEDEKSRRPASKSLALVFLQLQDFGALITGEEWLSYFKENDDSEEKHEAQRTMTLSYYERALNSLNNKKFKEALDDGEQALVYYKDDRTLTIKIRWLLVRAYFLQEDFKNALEQFDSESDMLSLKLDAEDYVKAGKIHQKMRRYHEAILYFKEAKKDAKRNFRRKVNKWIEEVEKSIKEANELIQDDIPPTLKDIGEIGIEKPENKTEIEEEQTFCHIEENIEKEASGDEGGPHTEDITKEQCEVLYAERTPFFEGVIKSISKLHPYHSHGNLKRGIAVLEGQAKFFNMKPPGIEGYKNDIDGLLYMITNIVDGVRPEKFFEGLDHGDYTTKIGRLNSSKEFSIFLKCLKDRKDEMVDIYHPFFWPEFQQMFFLERVYDLFWKDFKIVEKRNHWNDLMKLESCFSRQWNWANDIPSEGAFNRVFHYQNGPTWEIDHIPKAYAIAFWRHCKTHYNDNLAVGENRKTVEEIHIEVNKKFNILYRVFQAVCKFTERFCETTQNKVIYEKLVALRNIPAM